MPAPREADLPVNVYFRWSVTYQGLVPALAGTAIGYDRKPTTTPTTPVHGIAEFDARPNTDLTLAIAGVTQAITGAAVVIGDAISFDATGRAITSPVGGNIFGRALTAATDAGQKIQVLITREGTK